MCKRPKGTERSCAGERCPLLDPILSSIVDEEHNCSTSARTLLALMKDGIGGGSQSA
jgi:hypothetical protein